MYEQKQARQVLEHYVQVATTRTCNSKQEAMRLSGRVHMSQGILGYLKGGDEFGAVGLRNVIREVIRKLDVPLSDEGGPYLQGALEASSDLLTSLNITSK